jgi:23S rRNA pseudouridine2605 synthase
MPANRLSKVLAAAGVASRRACEELIVAGRVTINGAPVLLPQHPADPDSDHIKVDGKRIGPNPNKLYFILNKPKGFICTNERPKNGRIVGDLFHKGLPRLFTVGRLDKDTTGLLLVTNDGEFANQVIHPSSGITKEYLVKVREELDPEAMEALRRGAIVDDVFVRPTSVVRVRRGTARVTVSEGRKHEVRILVEKARLTLVSLERIRVGSIVLGDLPLGAFRPLTVSERKALLEAAAIGRAKPKRKRQVVVRRRDHAQNGRPGFANGAWDQEEREPMNGQDSQQEWGANEEALNATETVATDIQWEQITPPEQEASEEKTPRRAKREEFMERRERTGVSRGGFSGPNRGEGRREGRPEGRWGGEPRRSFGDRGPRAEGGFERRSSYDDRRPRQWGDRRESGFNRPAGDRPAGEGRGFNEFRPRPMREGERSDQPRRFGSRPFGNRSESGRPEGNRGGFSQERFGSEGQFRRAPREGFGERRPFREEGRGPRPDNFGNRDDRGDRPRFERRERSFENRPSEGGERRFGGGRERPRFEREGRFGDRPQRSGGFRGGFDRPQRGGRSFDRPQREGRSFDRSPAEGNERGALEPRLWRSE